jgi:hypothetical protein
MESSISGRGKDAARRLANGMRRSLVPALALAAIASVGVAAPAQAADTQPQDPAQCTPFQNSTDAQKALQSATSVVQLWTSLQNMPEAGKLYKDYLTPGKASPNRTRVEGSKVLGQFRDAAETTAAVTGVVETLKGRLSSLRPEVGVEYDLAGAEVGQDLVISWTDLAKTPGFIAGGLSGVEIPGQNFIADRRDITGKFSLVKNGNTATLQLRGLKLNVLDSVDFCPGSLGTGAIQSVSLDMSRLERTPYQNGNDCDASSNCTYAKPVLFTVSAPLNDVSVDVTDVVGQL